MTNPAPSRRFILTVLACAALAGCAAHDEFLKAQQAGTLDAWSDYVKAHPSQDHPNCDDCKAGQRGYEAAYSREKDAFGAAQNEGTAAALLAFADARNAKNPFYQQAVDGARAHLLAGEGGEGDYLSYLAHYAGDESSAAAMRRALLAFRLKRAKESDEPGLSAYFVAQYPGAAETAKLIPHLANKEYEKAKKLKTRLSLEFFLKKFPDYAHTDQVQSLLADLPRTEPVSDDGSAGEFLPKLRAASSSLRGQECLLVLTESVRASGDVYGAAAEEVRTQFASATDSADIAACRDAHMTVPASSRALVASALRALIQLSQRRARLGSLFDAPDALSAKSRKIGKTSAQLSETAEAFDLEMQAYYGFMPADPDKPQEKASKDAAEALRRAQRAYELTQGEAVGAKKKEAADLIDRMNAQEELLIKLIAFNEKPERRTP